jgi:hypothetical protein
MATPPEDEAALADSGGDSTLEIRTHERSGGRPGGVAVHNSGPVSDDFGTEKIALRDKATACASGDRLGCCCCLGKLLIFSGLQPPR